MQMHGIIELVIMSYTDRIDEAIFNLKEAISLDEKYGHDALDDKDFDKIRDDQKFVELLKRFK